MYKRHPHKESSKTFGTDRVYLLQINIKFINKYKILYIIVYKLYINCIQKIINYKNIS